MENIKRLIKAIQNQNLNKSDIASKLEDSQYKKKDGRVNFMPKKNPFNNTQKDINFTEKQNMLKPMYNKSLPMEYRQDNNVFDGSTGGNNG